MTARKPSPSPAKRMGAVRRELSWGEKWLIAVFLIAGLALAALSMIAVPSWLVSERDYPCPPVTLTASSQATTASGISPSCLGRAGGDGIDHQALDQARAAVRAPFGVLSAGLLAGAAAAIGVVVSNHNAALTRAALNAAVETNKITKERDDNTSTRESNRDHAAADRDRDAATRERERAADERFTTAIEQLGHPSASVRLGGMHSLHRLALHDSERRLTILDVFCAYLRQPFHHPRHDCDPEAPAAVGGSGRQAPARAWWPASQKERDERDSEGEVRRTAARLIPTLLPLAADPFDTSDALSSPVVNLSSAVLDDLDLSRRRTGNLVLDGAYINGDLRLGDGVYINGDFRLGSGARIEGHLLLSDGARIEGHLLLDAESRIVGDLRIDTRAYINGDLLLDHGGCIARNLQLDNGAHINGELRIDTFAHVEGDLLLSDNSYIEGSVLLGYLTQICGLLRLDTGAHIKGDLRLDERAGIALGLQLGKETHIDGELVLIPEKYNLGKVWLNPQAATNAGWFSCAGVIAEYWEGGRVAPLPSFSKFDCLVITTPAQ